jgi:hypothetical protein
MISTAESVRRIVAAPAPVLLGDTCALADLMRDPTRETLTGVHVETARRLLARTEAHPKTLWIALTDQVIIELSDNLDGIEQGAVTAIRQLEEAVNRVRLIMSAHGLVTAAPDLIAAGLPPVARQLVRRFGSVGLHVSTPRGAKNKAWARIAANIPPAQKGQQAKDCIVLESYLALARELRGAGFDKPIVFFTSNTADYSEPGKKACPIADRLRGQLWDGRVFPQIAFQTGPRTDRGLPIDPRQT